MNRVTNGVTHRVTFALVAACTVLAACGSLRTPPTAPVVVAPQSANPSAGLLAYEQRLEEKIRSQDARGDLAGEAVTLELLSILKPDDASVVTRRQKLKDRIEGAVQDHLRRGAEAYRRGSYDAAVNQFLAVLALSPEDRVAADRLRTIEQERNRRQLLVKQQRAAQLPDQGD